MLALLGFVDVTHFQREEDGESAVKLTLLYALESRTALQRYFDEYADAMRADGPSRFGNKFKISQQILTTPPKDV